MKKNNIVILAVLIISFIGFGFILYSRLEEKNLREEELKKTKPLITYVSVIKPQKNKIIDSILVSGTVISQENIDITSKVSGRITDLNFKEGDKIKKGQLIARIEKDDLEVQILQAKAQVNSAKYNLELLENGPREEEIKHSEIQINQAIANLEQVKVNMAQAENDYQRIQNLFKDGAASKEQLEKSKSQMDSFKKQIDILNEQINLAKSSSIITKSGNRIEQINSAKASLEQAKAGLKSFEIQLKNYSIVSPISGYIIKKNISNSNTVSPGQVILSVSKSDNLEVEFNIPQKYLSQIKINQVVSLKSEIFSNSEFKAKIKKIYPIIDSNNHLVKITAIPIIKNNLLKQGMTFDAEIITKVDLTAITLPTQAVLESDNKKYVYLFKNKKAHQQYIKIGYQSSESIQVLLGLNTNDLVILDGNSFIKSGDVVEIETNKNGN